MTWGRENRRDGAKKQSAPLLPHGATGVLVTGGLVCVLFFCGSVSVENVSNSHETSTSVIASNEALDAFTRSHTALATFLGLDVPQDAILVSTSPVVREPPAEQPWRFSDYMRAALRRILFGAWDECV